MTNQSPPVRPGTRRPDIGPTVWESDSVLYAECTRDQKPDIWVTADGFAIFKVTRLFDLNP